MRKGRKISQRVFTIIIGGIIAGMLAVIVIPLYKGYVQRKSVTEATSIMGAIITSQKVEKSRTGKFYSASTIAEFQARGIDISDTKYFTYATTPTPNGGFTVTATPTAAFGAGEPITYTRDPTEEGYRPKLFDGFELLQT